LHGENERRGWWKRKSLRGLKHDAGKGAEMGRIWYFYHVLGTVHFKINHVYRMFQKTVLCSGRDAN
jgi:hypothetical protein